MSDKENKKDFFAELSKVKTEPNPINKDELGEERGENNEEEAEGTLVVDVFKDNEDIIVQAAVAGVNEGDLDVSITNESITIRGKRARTHTVEEKDYYYQECFWGNFSRTIILPEEVDPEDSVAALKNGVLTVNMPRLNRKKSKKIKVEAN